MACVGSLLLCTLSASAQYVGKVGQGIEKKPTLRATAVYEFTGSMSKPNASRLVPVVVWDGEHYQPGGLYLARPEPLAVAGGTQYVLEKTGVPAGLFNVGSAAELNGGWVGLGRFAPNVVAPAPKRLAVSKKPPTLSGGAGQGKVADDDADASRPTLHRKTGSDTGASTPSSGSGSGTAGGSGSSGSGSSSGSSSEPTLHRRDTDSSGSTQSSSSSASGGSTPSGSSSGANSGASSGAHSGANSGSGSSSPSSPDSDDRPTLHRKDSSSDSSPAGAGSSSSSASTSDPDGPTLHRKDSETTTGSNAPAPDPDRPTLHRSSSDASSAPAPDPDRPMLHRHGDAAGELTLTAPDPDRPHLRYGLAGDPGGRILPAELKDGTVAGAETGSGSAVPIGQVVAISDTSTDEPHPFAYSFPSPAAQTAAEQAMHDLAIKALATAVHASFGPAAKSDVALRQSLAGSSSFGPGTGTRAKKAAAAPAGSDPLAEPEFHAYELSYGGGATYVYTAHTEAPLPQRRYVTVIAAPDFYGKPQQLFSQTTRGDMLAETPALHLIDAADTNGDHRAELLFEEQTGQAAGISGRQFAIYSVAAGQARLVYSTGPGVVQ